jgi:hypothetical protein
MVDPSETLIAALLFGAGVMFLVGSYKNRRLFGASGIIPQAISHGSIIPSSGASELVSPADGVAPPVIQPGSHAETTSWQRGIANITAANPSLGAQISARMLMVSESSTRTELMPLAQLLLLADGLGFAASTAPIRVHIKEVTGESL